MVSTPVPGATQPEREWPPAGSRNLSHERKDAGPDDPAQPN